MERLRKGLIICGMDAQKAITPTKKTSNKSKTASIGCGNIYLKIDYMNREQELQKEREKHPDFAKTAFRTAWIAFIVALLSTLTLCTFAVTTVETKQPTPLKTPLICPDCDSVPDVTYQYDSITSGSLPFDPITHKKGVLIQSDTI